jgi:hypothetical protein
MSDLLCSDIDNVSLANRSNLAALEVARFGNFPLVVSTSSVGSSTIFIGSTVVSIEASKTEAIVAVAPYFSLFLCLFLAGAYCHSATHMVVTWMPC